MGQDLMPLNMCHVEPGRRFKVVDWIVLDYGDAYLERKGDVIRQIASHSRIEGNEKTPCLPRDRITKIHANIGAWIKGDCPSSNGLGQSELFRDGGSDSFGLEFRRLSTDVAIVAV
jgi:hypothetical protein